jgi:hypothetical protein
MEQLINDLAVGDRSDADLAAEYDVEEQSIRVFRMRHKADIAAKKAGWTSQYDHIWSTKLENHVRVLTERWQKIMGQMELLEEHAQRERETIRSVDPEASEVPYNSREYLAYTKEERALSHQILEITGQLPQRTVAVTAEVKNPITDYGTIAMDADGNFYGVQQ